MNARLDLCNLQTLPSMDERFSHATYNSRGNQPQCSQILEKPYNGVEENGGGHYQKVHFLDGPKLRFTRSFSHPDGVECDCGSNWVRMDTGLWLTHGDGVANHEGYYLFFHCPSNNVCITYEDPWIGQRFPRNQWTTHTDRTRLGASRTAVSNEVYDDDENVRDPPRAPKIKRVRFSQPSIVTLVMCGAPMKKKSCSVWRLVLMPDMSECFVCDNGLYSDNQERLLDPTDQENYRHRKMRYDD